MLSLISISLVVVSGDEEKEKVDTVNNDYDEASYDEKSDDPKSVDENPPETDTTDDVASSVETEAAVEQEEEQQPTNEDTVDVENVAVAKQKGKYMNYDDYFQASALDASDSGYNWNGKLPIPVTIDWHTVIIP